MVRLSASIPFFLTACNRGPDTRGVFPTNRADERPASEGKRPADARKRPAASLGFLPPFFRPQDGCFFRRVVHRPGKIIGPAKSSARQNLPDRNWTLPHHTSPGPSPIGYHAAMNITLPELSLVVLIGASGSGKSTFARQHFLSTEVLSSDFCRGLVSDDENSQAATNDAFDVLHYIAAKRLAAGKLVVIDATNVQPESRKPLVALAREYHCLPVALVLDMPERVCQDRNTQRADRDFGPYVVRNHIRSLRQSLRGLEAGGLPARLCAAFARRSGAGDGDTGAALQQQKERNWPV